MNNAMKIYKVGGAVRDALLGVPAADVDHVVVGAKPSDMINLGFSQIGKDFPVFLHPETGEEYALARTEKKIENGFSVNSENVTLTEDLSRRDLTINAMAMTSDGELIDPFNGNNDINDKVLRHVSDAFTEDPVRVLRLARFRARLGPDWTVAPETMKLIYKMVNDGSLTELVPDRVWKETAKALMEDHPRLFFDTLLQTDSLKVVFPELYEMKSALESHRWHPEGDAYEHTMLVLNQSAQRNASLSVRFSALMHDLGKILTPRDKMPKHHGHDVNGVPLVEKFSNKYTVPAKMRDWAMKITRYHMYLHRLDVLNPKTYVKMFNAMNVLNDPAVVDMLYAVGVCDARGRLGFDDANVDHLNFLKLAYDAYKSVKFMNVFPEGEKNVNKIKNGMNNARINAVATAKNSFFSPPA